MMPDLEEIRSVEALRALRKPWGRLLEACPGATPFQSWEWTTGMARHRAGEGCLRVLVARDEGGELRGVAPLCLRPLVPGFPVLEWIGAGVSDYLEPVCRPEDRTAFCEALLRRVARSREWRVLRLSGLRQEAADTLTATGDFEVRTLDACSHAVLPDTLEAYDRSVLSKNTRKGMRRRTNLLEREGREAVFSIARTPEDLARDLKAYYALHQQRQRAKGERGRFFSRAWREAFAGISRDLLEAGILRLGLLRIDGRPASALYNLRLFEREYGYGGGMDEAFAPYAPSTLLEHWMIGEAIADGMRVYDLMRGREAYKASWTTDQQLIFEAVRARTRFDAIAYRTLEEGRRRLVRSRLLKQAYALTLGRSGEDDDA